MVGRILSELKKYLKLKSRGVIYIFIWITTLVDVDEWAYDLLASTHPLTMNMKT